MKNYSFSNIAGEQSYLSKKTNQRNQHFKYSELKSSDANLRIEEIKKKYDTPNRRERVDSLRASKEFELKENYSHTKHHTQSSLQAANNSAHSNCLKESFAVNRLEKNYLKGEVDSKEFVTLRGSDRNERIESRRPAEDRDTTDYRHNRIIQREEEEVFFTKMKEMKESFINNEHMKASINSHARPHTYQRNERQLKHISPSLHEYVPKKDQYDPRVENIDKINSKIKQILNCLTENQMRPSKYIKPEILNKSDEQGFLNNRESAFFGSKKLQKQPESYQSKKNYDHSHTNSQILERIQIKDFKDTNSRQISDENANNILKERLQKKLSNLSSNYKEPQQIPSSSTNNNNNSNGTYPYEYPKEKLTNQLNKERVREKNGDYSVNRLEKRETEDGWKNRSYLNNQSKNNNLKASRSKSYINSIKKSHFAVDNNYQLNSGKKLNDEITKIQKKIEEFQAEKKKLNIEFTPFSVKTKSTSNLFAINKFQKTEENSKHVKEIEDKNIQNQENTEKDYSFEEKRDQIRKEIAQGITSKDNYRSNHRDQLSKENKSLQNDLKTLRVERPIQISEQNSINSGIDQKQKEQRGNFDQAGLRKRTGQGMEERKKKLMEMDQHSSQNNKSIKALVSLFCEQAKLDEQFRNMKIWFECCLHLDKHLQLSQILSHKYQISLTSQECEGEFALSQSENNPFFTMQGFEGTYQLLAKAYVECKQFWKDNICHAFDRFELESDNFTANKIDLQKKGYFELEDLVRFLNIESGTFFRNRDIYLIMKRIEKGSKTNFNSLMNEICQEQL